MPASLNNWRLSYPTRGTALAYRLSLLAIPIAISFLIGNIPRCSYAFSYLNAVYNNGFNSITHPEGYNGTGGIIHIAVGINPDYPFSEEMVIPTLNAINTWNALVPANNNMVFGDANDMPPGMYDFESVLLHELGHALGLGHPNLGDRLIGNDNFTMSTAGNNGVFDVHSGPDGIPGSSDDIRGDDVNLNWFQMANNNPFSIGTVVDSTTYSRDPSDLPASDTYSTNPDRSVANMVYGLVDTESVMQQGIISDSARRTLGFDDVAGIRYAMSGIDEIAGTSDDYTINLVYAGFTNTANIVLQMKLTSGFSATGFVTKSIGSDHYSLGGAGVDFNSAMNWYFTTCDSWITATWDGSIGNWSEVAHWDTAPVFPNDLDNNVVINNGTVTVDQNISVGEVKLGTVASTFGTLHMNGVDFRSNRVSIGTVSGSTSAINVNGASTIWDTDHYVTVGDAGDGSVAVGSGAEVSAGALSIGRHTDSDGEVTVSDTDTVLKIATDIVVGFDGVGTLTIEDAGHVTAGFRNLIGARAGSAGYVAVRGSSSVFDISADLFIGSEGNGILTIEDGGLVSTGTNGIVGWLSGSSGHAVVRGTGSTWNTVGYLTVGENGAGTLTIEAGGQVNTTNHSGFIGPGPDGSGEVVVRGAGSRWTIANYLEIARDGMGVLRIEDGGEVVTLNNGGYIGVGTIGTATVTGTGSIWRTLNMAVGTAGQGTLAVENGGTVSVLGDCVIARDVGSTGIVTVDGMGSTWTNSDDLSVGYSGTGTLNITNGGFVSVGGTLAIDFHVGDGCVNVASGGMLALYGQADGSLDDFMDLINGTDAIRYWDDSISDWAAITSATYGDDYTLDFLTEGDLAGYTLLTVGMPELQADFDQDGDVDGDDFAVWKTGFGTTDTASHGDGDADSDGDVDGNDFLAWQRAFGMTATNDLHASPVPEPTSVILLLIAVTTVFSRTIRDPDGV